MESHSKISPSTQHFLFKLKEFLLSIDVSFDEFFTNLQTANKGQITKLEFFRVISLLNIQLQNNFDPQVTFAQLSKKEFTISLTSLKKLYEMMGNPMHERKVSEQKAMQDEMKKKIIRIGIFKLSQFMKNHQNPVGFLKEFDRDGNNEISKNQFNSLLVATEIKELSNKEIRRILIEEIYKYYLPKKEATIKQLSDLFKVSHRAPIFKPLSPNKHIPKPFLEPPEAKHNIKPAQNTQNPFGKKKTEGPETVTVAENTPKVDDMQNQISNCEAQYPKAMRYFRQGNPEPNQHENMQQLQDLLNQNRKYVDTNNPAITEGKYVPASEIFKTEKYHMFQMASSVLVREVSRIGIAREIEPKDIIQGSVGDCYFLSSIASIISIYPELIAERFLFNKNPANYYAVKLFIDGEWKVIKTDDQFPCKNNFPLYAKPHTNEIWVMLLEKCWAKNFGSYRAIESGSSKEGFMVLTGAPSSIISHEKDKNEAESIKQLQYAHGHKYVATVSGSSYLESLGKGGEEKLGLISGHAYSLLRTVKINNQTLVKLRNPWGKTIWKGLWSFSSSVWTKELRDRFNYNKDPQDGSFYMSWKDFQIYFGEIVVCKLNPTFMHTSIHVRTDRRKSGYLLMKVRTPGQYIVSIYQQGKRKLANKYSNYSYSPSRIIVLKREGKALKYIGAKSITQVQACSLDMEMLDVGEYLISAKVQWKFWDNHQMIVTSYGTDYVSLSPINRAIAHQFKQGLIKSYSNTFAGTGKIKGYQKYGFNAKCETNFNIDTGIGFVRMINNSDKSFESVQQMSVKGLKVIKPDRLPLVFKMGPKSDKTYGFFIKAEGYEYSNTERITY